EDRARQRERTRETIPALHGADEHAHRDRERRRQDASQQEHHPPGGGEPRGRARQDGEELPFLALAQAGSRCLLQGARRISLERGESAPSAVLDLDALPAKAVVSPSIWAARKGPMDLVSLRLARG